MNSKCFWLFGPWPDGLLLFPNNCSSLSVSHLLFLSRLIFVTSRHCVQSFQQCVSPGLYSSFAWDDLLIYLIKHKEKRDQIWAAAKYVLRMHITMHHWLEAKLTTAYLLACLLFQHQDVNFIDELDVSSAAGISYRTFRAFLVNLTVVDQHSVN